MKTVIFYSSVKDKSLFRTQSFYQTDIGILTELGYNVILSNKISDAFLFWKYDMVFGYFYRYSFFFILIARLCGKKSFLTGGIDSLDRKFVGDKEYKIQRLFFKLCYLVATKCIIVSHEDLKHVEEIVGPNRDKIVFSEHSISTSMFANTIPLAERENSFVSICWQGTEGNIVRKGIDKAIELFSLLAQRDSFRDSKFYILGRKGAGTPYLEGLIRQSSAPDRIIITGEVSEEEKIDFLKHNRYYFQLSQYEGFGVASLEALVAGDIVLHSGKGGLKNPIYDTYVHVDVDEQIEKQVDVIYHRLLDFDQESIVKSVAGCCLAYDNGRRRQDLKEILAC